MSLVELALLLIKVNKTTTQKRWTDVKLQFSEDATHRLCFGCLDIKFEVADDFVSFTH